MCVIRLEPALPTPRDEPTKSLELGNRVRLRVPVHALFTEDAEQVEAQRVGEVEHCTQRVFADPPPKVAFGTRRVKECVAVALERVGASPQAGISDTPDTGDCARTHLFQRLLHWSFVQSAVPWPALRSLISCRKLLRAGRCGDDRCADLVGGVRPLLLVADNERVSSWEDGAAVAELSVRARLSSGRPVPLNPNPFGSSSELFLLTARANALNEAYLELLAVLGRGDDTNVLGSDEVRGAGSRVRS